MFAWRPWTSADKEVLEQVQRRAVNMISDCRVELIDHLKELKLEFLENSRTYVQKYNIIHGLMMYQVILGLI